MYSVSSKSTFDLPDLYLILDRVGITLAFTIPRVPGFSFNQDLPLGPASGSFNSSIPVIFSRAPANFSFPAYVDLQVDTTSNYLPLKFNELGAQVFDLDTYSQVGTGALYSHTVPGRTFTKITVPLNFTYIATNDSDTTCKLLFSIFAVV
jgi:hypothetical protein